MGPALTDTCISLQIKANFNHLLNVAMDSVLYLDFPTARMRTFF